MDGNPNGLRALVASFEKGNMREFIISGEGLLTMTASLEEVPGSFVVVFFHTRAGELRCRVTDVVARTTWIVEGPAQLWQLLVRQRAQPEVGDAQS